VALAFFNGEFTEESELFIHVSDLSIHRGYAVFEYFKLIDGKNPWFDWYMDRFFASMKTADLTIPFTREDIKKITETIVERNQAHNSCIKLITTGGYSEDGFTPQKRENFLVLNKEIKKLPPSSYTEGIKLITYEYQRPMPEVKSTNYFNSVALGRKLRKEQAVDVLYISQNELRETSRCNIFLVFKDHIATPAKEILQGITRRRILNMTDPPLPIVERQINREELRNAQEVFISSTTKNALPVSAVDNIEIGTGRVGDVTQKILDKLSEF
jgi:D-alanine transaminase/branched-chain amino acid aminotransferase